MSMEKSMSMLDRLYDCGYYDRNTKDYDPRGSKAYDEVLSHIVEISEELQEQNKEMKQDLKRIGDVLDTVKSQECQGHYSTMIQQIIDRNKELEEGASIYSWVANNCEVMCNGETIHANAIDLGPLFRKAIPLLIADLRDTREELTTALIREVAAETNLSIKTSGLYASYLEEKLLSLQDKLAEAEKDAKRYRWIAEYPLFSLDVLGRARSKQEADYDIDAAIAEQGKP